MGNSFDPIKSSLGPANCPRGNLSFILALSARESFRLPIQGFARKKGATVRSRLRSFEPVQKPVYDPAASLHPQGQAIAPVRRRAG
jgi:hypothetical protein